MLLPLLVACLAGPAAGPTERPEGTNRLIQEASPYLRQHAHNPVDWYPWGDEAFTKATATGRLIFLSIGYSTCHWCHVMAHESFEDEEVAALLNERFVSIKVDREERPDVDTVYMDAVTAMNRGRGGWPMTLVLTPDGEPIFAATYLPARDGDRGSRRGLLWILKKISDDWATDPQQLRTHAAKVTQHLVTLATPAAPTSVPDMAVVERGVQRLTSSFDPDHGGFGSAPKFPRPVALGLLLHAPVAVAGQREMVRDTLIAMANGGIHDHLAGGFHRYAVDAEWRVPHFEKMLYDNAQLIETATDAWRVTRAPELPPLVESTVRYLLRDMRLSHGAFASATDADSLTPTGDLEEGAFYTWTPEEAAAALGPERAWVAPALGITAGGNLDGRSVLWRAAALEPSQLPALPDALAALHTARANRPAPLRDDKVVTAWNALTVRALARAGATFGRPEWIAAAVTTAQTLLGSVQGPQRRLPRSVLDGARAPGVLEDEAAFALACIELFETTGDPTWLDEATHRLTVIDGAYRSPEGGWYRTPSDADALLVRPRDDHEGAEPSGTSMALHALLRLAHLTDDPRWVGRADEVLAALAPAIERAPTAMPAVLAAVARRHAAPTELVVVHPDGAPEPTLSAAVRTAPHPFAERVVVSASAVESLATRVPWLEGKRAIDGRSTAYVCQGGTCQRPVHSAAELEAQLSAVTAGASGE